MRYFKWQSDDKLILIEKFVGEFTFDFINLSDKYILDYNKGDLKLNFISEVTDASFTKMTKSEMEELASNFFRSVPKELSIRYCLVLGSEDRNDQEMIQALINSIKQYGKFDFAIHDTLNSAFNRLNVEKAISTKIDQEINTWLKSHKN